MNGKKATLGQLFAATMLLAQLGDRVSAQQADSRIWLPGATGSGPFDVAEAWATAFVAVYPEAHVTLSSVGSGAAQKALWGSVDCEGRPVDAICAQNEVNQTVWGLGDAPIESKVYEEQSVHRLQQFPACSGAVAVAYSKEVSTEVPLRLTFDVLAGIFNSSIVYWDDPSIQAINPTIILPDKEISTIVRSDSSGQTSILTDALGYHVPTWPDEAVGQLPEWPLGDLHHPSELVQSCALRGENETLNAFEAEGKSGISLGMLRVPYSIGYVEAGALERWSEFLGMAEIGKPNDPDSFVGPTEEGLVIQMDGLSVHLDPNTLGVNLAASDAPLGGYPIAGYAYWYLKKDASAYTNCYQAWLVCKFVEWSYTHPQAAELARGYGWVVPPESVVEKTLERLREVQCLNKEENPPKVISAMSYTPPPYRTESEVDVEMYASIGAAVFVILVVLLCRWREMHKRNADHVWKVDKKELIFQEPPQVIGRGSFGLVLLAEYRGTRVAVKRALAPNNNKGGSLKKSRGKGSVTKNPIFDAERDATPYDSGSSGGSGGSGSDGSGTGLNSGEYNQPGEGSTVPKGPPSGSSLQRKSSLFRFTSSNSRTVGRQDFIEEMRILARLRHPCITTVMGAVLNMYEEPMLIMEYMEHGSLYDILHNDTLVLDEELIVPIIQDVSQGLRFLHAGVPPVIHGDLKAKNVLVDRRFRAKVADFGLSQRSTERTCGTPYFMAPELLAGKSVNSATSDVYAFGILLYESFSRKDPYEGEKIEVVIQEIIDPEINKRPPVPPQMPESIVGIMQDCLETDPELRPSAAELDNRLKRVDADKVASNKPLKPKGSNVSLFDIFPRHVAEALRDGRKVEPEHKDCVTLFFSDIVGFTDISASLKPEKVAQMLDRLYNIFDDISAKHDVFKVETIGDAYMACTNLVKDQSQDHAKRIALFAIEAMEAASKTLIDFENPELGYINIRAGFHSGPVVADVVGNRNPRYCLFGDTVNTASRMESSSERNRIQCSKPTRDLIRRQMPQMSISLRGKIPIKGKGNMITYWVNEKPNAIGNVMTSYEELPLTELDKSGRQGTMDAKQSITPELPKVLKESAEAIFAPEAPRPTSNKKDLIGQSASESAESRNALRNWLKHNSNYEGDNMV